MEIITVKDRFIELYKNWDQVIIVASLLILFLIPFIFFVKKLINFLFINISKNYGQGYLKLDEKYHTNRYLFHSILVLYLILCINLLNIDQIFPAQVATILSTCIFIYGSFSFTALFLSIINVFANAYKDYFLDRHFPIHLPIQILKIFIICWIIIIAISRILLISPISIITSLGATTAFLTFVFKDVILGLIASLQLIVQNKIQIGDCINVPQYNIAIIP